MIWALFSLFSGLTYCVQSELNKHYKIDGFRLNTFRSLFSALLMVPLIPFMEWPTIPEYYLVLVLEGAISVVGMMVQYNLAATQNGRIANLHQPIAIMLTFVFWLSIDETQRAFLLANPVKGLCIMLAFMIFITSLQFIRRGEMGMKILLSVIPVAVLYSLMSVISKIALEHGDSLLEISLNFVFISNIMMFLLSFPVLVSQKMRPNAKKPPLVIDKKLIKAAFSIGFFHTISWVSICIAIILTPNPAYPGIITGLGPIWFMLYYKARGIPDSASPIAGLFMTVAALLLLFVTN